MRKKRGIIENSSGVVAIEAALLFPVLFFLLLAILETTYVFVIAIVLEGATSEAGRQVKTNSFQASATPQDRQDSFNETLCNNMFGLISCNELNVDVRNFTQFSGINPPPFDPNPDGEGNEFLPGNPGDIVLVRVLYKYKFITPMLGTALMDQTGANFKSIMSNIVFRNEPA